MAENRENRPDIYCPFRVLRVEHPPMLRGHGTSTTEEFYPCLGKRCAAYYSGGCLRLVPPALVIDDRTFTDADIERLRQELKQASVHSVSVPPEPWQDCHNCGNKETKDGCADCTAEARNGRRVSIPSMWKPKERPEFIDPHSPEAVAIIEELTAQIEAGGKV